jgi:hypothetical protein
MSPIAFLQEQILLAHPLLLPVWLLGLCYFFFLRMGRDFRLFGWISVAVFVLLVTLRGKPYYAAPVYPALFGGGAIVIESIIKKRDWNSLKPAIIIIFVIGGLITAPMALPVLPVETFIRYSRALGIKLQSGETNELGELPQHFADMFGWEEMVKAVAAVYSNLTPEEQSRCTILTSNYGQAGAIDFFGGKHNLPKSICGHNSYYLWGPRDYTGEITISLMNKEGLLRFFDEVTQVGIIERKYSMPYENNRPIYLCRKPKASLREAWPWFKDYI